MTGYSVKTRALSLLLVLALMLALVPASAMAATTRYVKTSTGQSLNVHSTRMLGSANIVGHVAYGAKVSVITDYGTWSYIQYTKSGKTRMGYVLSRLLTGGTSTTSTTSSSELKKTNQTKYVVTGNKKSLNMRSSMSTKNAKNIITTLPYGAKVTMTGYNSAWAYVNYNGKKGYVVKSYLSSSKPKDAAADTTTYYRYTRSGNGKPVNFRQSTSTDSKLLDSIKVGTKVTCHGTVGLWTRVTYGGKNGYILTSLLSKTKK